MNESVNDKGVCRTARATPGMLSIHTHEAIKNMTHLLADWQMENQNMYGLLEHTNKQHKGLNYKHLKTSLKETGGWDYDKWVPLDRRRKHRLFEVMSGLVHRARIYIVGYIRE